MRRLIDADELKKQLITTTHPKDNMDFLHFINAAPTVMLDEDAQSAVIAERERIVKILREWCKANRKSFTCISPSVVSADQLMEALYLIEGGHNV